MAVAIELEQSAEWMTQRQAASLLGRSPTVVQRLALIGEVRTSAEPGCPVRYNRPDVERIAHKVPPAVPRRRAGA